MKKKIFLHALILLMVFSFASMASAVQYAYVSNDKTLIGTIEVTASGLTQNAASKSFDMTEVELYPAGENVLAVGTVSTSSTSYHKRFVLFDKSLAVVSSADLETSTSLSLDGAALFNGKFLAYSGYLRKIIEIDPTATKIDYTTAKSFDISKAMSGSGETSSFHVYAMNVNDNTLYVMSSTIPSDSTKSKIFSMTTFPTVVNSSDISEALGDPALSGSTGYVGSDKSLFTLNKTTLKLTSVLSADVIALTADGNGGVYFVTEVAGETTGEEGQGQSSSSVKKFYHWDGTTSSDVTSSDVYGQKYLNLDYDSDSKVLVLVDNFSNLFASYKLTNGKFKIIKTADVYDAAKFETADNGGTKTTTGKITAVTSKDLGETVYAAIKTITGGKDTVSYDTADYSGNDTNKTAIINAISGDVSGSKVNNLITLGDVKPSTAGWIVVSADLKGSYAANLLKGFFVKKSSTAYTASLASLTDASLSATGDIVEATLTDANGNKLSGNGSVSSAYAVANLEATEYAVVAAEGTTTNGSSGSGGGCNAGFGILGFLILTAALKLKK